MLTNHAFETSNIKSKRIYKIEILFCPSEKFFIFESGCGTVLNFLENIHPCNDAEVSSILFSIYFKLLW